MRIRFGTGTRILPVWLLKTLKQSFVHPYIKYKITYLQNLVANKSKSPRFASLPIPDEIYVNDLAISKSFYFSYKF